MNLKNKTQFILKTNPLGLLDEPDFNELISDNIISETTYSFSLSVDGKPLTEDGKVIDPIIFTLPKYFITYRDGIFKIHGNDEVAEDKIVKGMISLLNSSKYELKDDRISTILVLLLEELACDLSIFKLQKLIEGLIQKSDYFNEMATTPFLDVLSVFDEISNPMIDNLCPTLHICDLSD